MIVVKNQQRGWLRYPEMLVRLMRLRWGEKPDVYLVTFRGQEILPLVLALAGRRPVIFDEFIVPIAYATGEGHVPSAAVRAKHALAKASRPLYGRWLQRCACILADTQAHAELSARTSQLGLDRFCVLPVGADEELFAPPDDPSLVRGLGPFEVLYYGNMVPLHGLPVVIDAAVRLKDRPDIHFVIVGGRPDVEERVATAVAAGARLAHEAWVPFEQLPLRIRNADLVLGGPFGGTPQAQRVVTGKTYQALACAAATVVCRSQATAPVFLDGKNALVVDQDDSAALAEIIRWAGDHRGEVAEIGRAGRRLYEERFSHRVIAATLAEVVGRLGSTGL
jgi:glycosyltransferase involved in cell wall biosynthesis